MTARSKAILAGVVAMAFASVAMAAVKLSWHPDPTTDAELNDSVTWKNMVIRNTGGELYNSSYYHDALFDDGTVIYNQFFIHNMGPGSDHPSADLTIIDPDGKVHRQTETFDKIKPEFATDRFKMTFGEFSLEGDPAARPQVYKLKSKFGASYGVELTYTCDAPAFFDKGVYFNDDKNNNSKWVTYCPIGAVEGTITVDGKTRKVKGRGFADHAETNPTISVGAALIEGMGVMSRGSNPKFGFALMEYHPAANGKGVNMPNVLFSGGGKNLIFTRDYKMELDGWIEKNGAKFPTVFRMTIDKPNFKLKGEIKMERFLLGGSTLDGVNSKTVRIIIAQVAGDSRWARFVSRFKFDVEAGGKKFTEEGRSISQVIFSK